MSKSSQNIGSKESKQNASSSDNIPHNEGKGENNRDTKDKSLEQSNADFTISMGGTTNSPNLNYSKFKIILYI